MYCKKDQLYVKGKFCWLCGQPTTSDDTKCPWKGCEGNNDAWNKFCIHCGRPMQEVVERDITDQKGQKEE